MHMQTCVTSLPEAQENPQVTGVSQNNLLLLWLSFRLLKSPGVMASTLASPPALSPADYGTKE